MIYPPEILDALQEAAVPFWNGTVYRHMFGSHPPARPNVSGARWNPPETEAIYSSCERETALAEAEYYLSLQPLRPKARRTLYTVRVAITFVVDLTRTELLYSLRPSSRAVPDSDFSASQIIGGAVAWLGYGGLLVPSVRRQSGTNLVIFQRDLSSAAFEVLEDEIISGDAR